ncbi:hypothetical protein PINS_up007252 [Pythium insidiosum]|nr:hypothetical protein PINS_up007252 [Pythium insidiosum]
MVVLSPDDCAILVVIRNRSLLSLLTELFNASETQHIMIRRFGFIFRARGVRDQYSGRRTMHRSIFGQAVRLIIPHCSDRDVDELWEAVGSASDSSITLSLLTKRLVVVERTRSASPEPGPTHYHPSYVVVEPKPPAAVILPETEPVERVAGLPSEFFMNVDAFKAVRPRVRGGIFPKRKFTTSWCNPVPRVDDGGGTDDGDERGDDPKPRRPRASPRGHRLSPGRSAQFGSTLHPDFMEDSRRSPALSTSRRSDTRDSSASGAHGSLSSTTEGRREQPVEVGGKESSVRLAKRTQADTTTPHTGSSSSAATASAPASPTLRRRSSFLQAQGRSILHDDIAPLYQKFLNSKEVQKAMKQ